jgi:uncharacterized protein (DUF1684 family)
MPSAVTVISSQTLTLLSSQTLLVLGCVLLGAVLASCTTSPNGRVNNLGNNLAAHLAAERDAWHAQRLRTLTAEDGWLTLVGLDFLPEGESTIGSSPSATFRYEGCSKPIVGTFAVTGAQVQFTPADGTAIACTPDDRGTPTVVRSGPVSFTLVRRNGRLALRVRDNESEIRTKFSGIALFAYDPLCVVEASVHAAKPSETIAITNVTGFVEETPVAARLRFVLQGEQCEFVATAGANGRLFVVFGDATNGTETYGGGRFLDIPAPVDGKTVIDFNRATNPPCSFTAFATCPLPPAGNRVSIAVHAGERVPR